MRERLIELLIKGNNQPCGNGSPWEDNYCKGCEYENKKDCRVLQLADYLLANGIIVPPVKVGQTVWLIKPLNWQRTEWGIKEGKVSMIQQKADKSWKFRVTENHSVQDYTVDEIGKTVFLTREEAEKALVNYESSKSDNKRKENE